jgi:hypothetical protein
MLQLFINYELKELSYSYEIRLDKTYGLLVYYLVLVDLFCWA